MPNVKGNVVLEYGRTRGVRHRRAIIVMSMIAAVLLAFFGVRWLNSRGRNQWKTSQSPNVTSDFYGNIIFIDQNDEQVSIIATNLAGWGWDASFTKDRFVVAVGGEPSRTVSVKRQTRSLVVALPDGSEQQFPIPEGFARQLLNGFNRGNDSILSDTLRLYQHEADYNRLSQFLARHKAPNRRDPAGGG